MSVYDPYGVIPSITLVAQSMGLDPNLAIAIAQQESGLNPQSVGDNGTSFGLYQLHEGGELGNLTQAQAFNPVTNARTALMVVDQVARAHPNLSPGEIAALAQRPLHPQAYAASVNARYAILTGNPVTTGTSQLNAVVQSSTNVLTLFQAWVTSSNVDVMYKAFTLVFLLVVFSAIPKVSKFTLWAAVSILFILLIQKPSPLPTSIAPKVAGAEGL